MRKTYTLSEVCEMIGCDSERWILTRVRRGEFPARQINRQVRFTEADVESILESCTYKPEVRGITMPELSERSKARM